MKLLRYLVNTILFILIWCISTSPFVLYSLSLNGTRPSGIAGAGGIIAIFISYALVKKINKSNLLSSLFVENQELNNEERFINERINSFVKDLFKTSLFEITLILVITLSLLAIYFFSSEYYFSYKVEYALVIICSTPLLILAYLIKKRYFKANKNNKSSNIK